MLRTQIWRQTKRGMLLPRAWVQIKQGVLLTEVWAQIKHGMLLTRAWAQTSPMSMLGATSMSSTAGPPPPCCCWEWNEGKPGRGLGELHSAECTHGLCCAAWRGAGNTQPPQHGWLF